MYNILHFHFMTQYFAINPAQSLERFHSSVWLTPPITSPTLLCIIEFIDTLPFWYILPQIGFLLALFVCTVVSIPQVYRIQSILTYALFLSLLYMTITVLGISIFAYPKDRPTGHGVFRVSKTFDHIWYWVGRVGMGRGRVGMGTR